MSDQANSQEFTQPTGNSQNGEQHGSGHGRRAVMLGAAAVGAGAVAGLAASGGTALAATDAPAATNGFVALSRPIVVRLPATPLNIDQSIRVLQQVLTAAGHTGCFSGLDLQFTYENEYIVNAKGGIQAEI
jgi:hypothetical protein